MKNFFIYVKSFVDLIFLFLFKSRFSFCTIQNNLLFINTGQIGDLIISSALLENDKILTDYNKVFLIIQERFLDLFYDYQGGINFIAIDINKFKYNYLYRIIFIWKLKQLNISQVYNLTSVRSTWNDSLALTIGANQKYCFENTWNSLIKVFANYTDNLYDYKIPKKYFNEYDRIKNVIRMLESNSKLKETKDKTIVVENKLDDNFDIIIAPFSSMENRDINIKHIKILAEKFAEYKILVLSSQTQKEKLKRLKVDNIKIATGEYRLSQLYSVINNSKVFIGVDSGLTHIALKTKTKVIAIIGKGNYGRYLPKPHDIESTYLFADCEFAGCEWHCKKKSVECIKNVSSDRIITEIQLKLRNNENS